MVAIFTLLLSIANSSYQLELVVFYCCERDSKSYKLFRSLQNIIIEFVVSRMLILALISCSSVSLPDFGERCKGTKSNWYHCHRHFPHVFQLCSKILLIVDLFYFFSFYSLVHKNDTIHLILNYVFFLINNWSGRDLVVHFMYFILYDIFVVVVVVVAFSVMMMLRMMAEHLFILFTKKKILHWI